MGSPLLVGFLFGVGVGGWVYSKMYRSSGGNTQSALIVSGVAGFFAMVLMAILLGSFLK